MFFVHSLSYACVFFFWGVQAFGWVLSFCGDDGARRLSLEYVQGTGNGVAHNGEGNQRLSPCHHGIPGLFVFSFLFIYLFIIL